ncbi:MULTISPECIES: chaperonin family protein RbcX [Trichocoleus]|uniref:RuBisCO chaperone RbcX n=1 Tax=Trichocoleus desertorum GB2-A4 TaxID=2933944 RepID=A0ABV0J2G6_9CYAN|nr:MULTISPECIES: chaperonin family protein RbcX [unclassified Trichocoleus]MBD1860585.1 chaperonin family protein RbcX [Trichocoleus sp. FACHB-46]MBD2119682.1 chaperonin family protein RbcX [Trichocoleus sp. FACHB-262]
MDIKRIAKDTTKVLVSYLTYQAMRTVLAQLSETNPPLALWLHRFSGQGTIQDGELYLKALLKENQELAFRIMTVREHLAESVTEFLPEMARADIKQANVEHRRQQLERMSQLTTTDAPPQPEPVQDSESNLDNLPG